jgi:chitodextrinase
VAVARNIQEGELGRAKFYTHDRAFLKPSRIQTPFDSIQTYDAKGWELLKQHGQQGDWFWNVAGNMPKPTIKPSDIDSSREWGDFKDFEKHYKD